MSDLTPEVVNSIRQQCHDDPYSTQVVTRTVLLKLLDAVEKRDRLRARNKTLDDTLLINQQYYTQQLEALLTPLRKRIAELEGMLDQAPHATCQDIFHPGFGVDCSVNCVRCKWEAMKGGAR